MRADPAAERREYHYFWDMSKYVTMYKPDSYKHVPETNVAGPNFAACTDTDTHLATWLKTSERYHFQPIGKQQLEMGRQLAKCLLVNGINPHPCP